MNRTLEDDKIYSFNLSAFISAARSVIFFMQKEFKHIPGFVSWYKGKEESMRSDPDFKFFLEMRNTTIHVSRVTPNKKVTIGIFELANEPTSTSSKTVERFFTSYPEKKLDALCEKYLQNLTMLVDESEKLFHKTG
jgi:hypothetical protein